MIIKPHCSFFAQVSTAMSAIPEASRTYSILSSKGCE